MIGQVISHYKILEKLGEGGMGVVYKAQDTKLDRLVALKFLPHHAVATEAEQARFLQEAKSAAVLNHPNVCVIHSIEEAQLPDGGKQFIVMEYVDGTTLRELIEKHHDAPMKVNDAVGFAIQIGDALQEAHSKGIVHRDIKSENIMVNAKRQIKVMDFGLAKLKGSLKLTRSSSTVGTLAYMAPEQLQGGEVDARSDIFSFGAVLFEMLTGKLPFRGEHEAAMMYSIVNEDPEPAQRLRPELSPEILHVLARSLEKDPADRYQSAQDMLIDLRRLQKQSAKVSRASMANIPVPGSEVFTPNPTQSSATAKRKSSLLKFLAIGIGLVLVGVVIKVLAPFGSNAGAEPFQSIKMSRLTTSGKAHLATISPDGRYVVHAVVDGEKSSLWTRQVATTSNVMIVPPSNVEYLGLTFSNDGNFVSYLRSDGNNLRTLYEIPVLGGTPRKILSDLATAISYSPDGKHIAFVRQFPAVGEEVLMIANADGTGERKISVRRGDDFFITGSGTAASWSPDGKMIAIAAASNKGVQHFNLTAYSAIDGSEKIVSKGWRSIGRVVWCSDGRGIIMVGSTTTDDSQVWYVQYPEGTPRAITKDLSDYHPASLGVTTDASALVTTSVLVRSNLWVLSRSETAESTWNSQRARQITTGSGTEDGLRGLTWTPDGRILFTSVAGATGLSIIDMDGTNQRRISNEPFGDASPEVSHDGKYIFFVSEKDTTPSIWRMDIDGGNRTKLTFAEDYDPSTTPDGLWLIYSGWATGKTLLYKVPASGGDTVSISSNAASRPKVSPDGKLIVCNFLDEKSGKWGKAILSMESGALQRFFILPSSASGSTLRWSPDGKSLTYIDTRDGVSNIWSMPADGGEPRQITDFASGLIFRFEWSTDGRYLVLARGEQTSDVVLITSVTNQ